ncbi:high-potential iron-sulfur protein [Bdellovibrio sp. NC01]|uniref:high-potential iron-sulfur protein n=1 Tax=Bdellovibrio sp. NC01 TaxID=2220073 RepID=UPI001FEE3FB1|nr:high-potential iron-sulfur protein [Bdellovibrio sp. NC01]
MIDNKMNRRGFFKALASVVGVAAVAPTVLNTVFSSQANAQEKRRGSAPAAGGAAMPMVDPNDAVAKAVKYVEDHNKSPEAKGNHCGTCGFYAKKETRNGKEVGTCTIFAGKLVYNNAWCGSWNKKA